VIFVENTNISSCLYHVIKIVVMSLSHQQVIPKEDGLTYTKELDLSFSILITILMFFGKVEKDFDFPSSAKYRMGNVPPML
jgi:hypothetical protein